MRFTFNCTFKNYILISIGPCKYHDERKQDKHEVGEPKCGNVKEENGEGANHER